jgi:hypothetical protein
MLKAKPTILLTRSAAFQLDRVRENSLSFAVVLYDQHIADRRRLRAIFFCRVSKIM